MSDYAARLDAVERRFAVLAEQVLAGLTDEDAKTGERWDAGQVWAHTAEFPGYWLRELAMVVERYDGEPVPFGRIKTDPERVAAIERDRRTEITGLHARIRDGVAAVQVSLAALPASAWQARGAHSTLGVMSLDRIVEEFIVGHLEEHAAQLESLAHAPG